MTLHLNGHTSTKGVSGGNEAIHLLILASVMLFFPVLYCVKVIVLINAVLKV